MSPLSNSSLPPFRGEARWGVGGNEPPPPPAPRPCRPRRPLRCSCSLIRPACAPIRRSCPLIRHSCAGRNPRSRHSSRIGSKRSATARKPLGRAIKALRCVRNAGGRLDSCLRRNEEAQVNLSHRAKPCSVRQAIWCSGDRSPLDGSSVRDPAKVPTTARHQSVLVQPQFGKVCELARIEWEHVV